MQGRHHHGMNESSSRNHERSRAVEQIFTEILHIVICWSQNLHSLPVRPKNMDSPDHAFRHRIRANDRLIVGRRGRSSRGALGRSVGRGEEIHHDCSKGGLYCSQC